MQIYGTTDLEKIRSSCYTKSKHKAFKENYGYLIQGWNTKKIGKFMSIFLPVFEMVQRALYCAGLVYFVK